MVPDVPRDPSAEAGAKRRRRRDDEEPDGRLEDAPPGPAADEGPPADLGMDEHSTGKSGAAATAWLVGAALMAGSAVSLLGVAGGRKPEPDIGRPPHLAPEAGPAPEPDPHAATGNENSNDSGDLPASGEAGVGDAAGEAQAPMPVPVPVPVPVPGYTLRSTARDHYPEANAGPGTTLFHTGNDVNREGWIEVKPMAGAMAWRYSLDGGMTYQTGTGDRISLSNADAGDLEVRIQQQDAAGHWSPDNAFTLSVDLTAPAVSAQHFLADSSGPQGTQRAQRTEFSADEDVQVLFIPVDSTDVGTAAGQLRGWLQPGLMIKAGEPGGPGKRDGFPGPEGLYAAVAVDRAGNAAFVSMRGQDSDPGHEGIHHVMVQDRQFSGTRAVDAKVEGDQSIAREERGFSDHLYGSAAADVFHWMLEARSSDKEVDWIHGYRRAQGDVIQLGGLRFDTTSPGDVGKYLRKDLKTDGTISLWIDVDGKGETSASSYDQRILVTPGDTSTDLQIRLTRSGSEFFI
jgi:hypothetical protein